MNSYEKGNLSESMLAAKLLERGYTVLIPFGGGHRYDIAIETQTGFKKVQVKTGRMYKDKITFNVCSNNKGYKRKPYHGEIDFFGVYFPRLNTCYLVPVEETGVSEMGLRMTNPVHRFKGAKYAIDYII